MRKVLVAGAASVLLAFGLAFTANTAVASPGDIFPEAGWNTKAGVTITSANSVELTRTDPATGTSFETADLGLTVGSAEKLTVSYALSGGAQPTAGAVRMFIYSDSNANTSSDAPTAFVAAEDSDGTLEIPLVGVTKIGTMGLVYDESNDSTGTVTFRNLAVDGRMVLFIQTSPEPTESASPDPEPSESASPSPEPEPEPEPTSPSPSPSESNSPEPTPTDSTSPEPELTLVTPEKPKTWDPDCEGNGPSYDWTSEGVIYYHEELPHAEDWSWYTVGARPAEGYKFPEGAVTQWRIDVNWPTDCDEEPTPTEPTPTPSPTNPGGGGGNPEPSSPAPSTSNVSGGLPLTGSSKGVLVGLSVGGLLLVSAGGGLLFLARRRRAEDGVSFTS